MNNKFVILGLLGIILFTVIIETSDRTFAQTTMELERGVLKDYELIKPRKPIQPLIYLKSRVVTPGVGIDPEVRKRLEALPFDRIHVLLYLDHIPNAEERERLSKNGVSLLSYIHNNGWLASLPKDRLDEVAKISPIRWVGEILPGDKLAGSVRTRKFGNWSYDPVSDTVNLTIFFFRDVPLDEGRKIVSQYKGQIEGDAPTINAIVSTVPVSSIIQLSREESVQWIAEVEAPPVNDNDGLRSAIGVNVVQAQPYNLSGSDVVIVQFEASGVPDILHPDLSGRSQAPSGGVTDDHAMHVAGTAIGNGSLSESDGGYPLQWRGVATNATMVSYLASSSVATMTTRFNTSINTYGANISTNSWSVGGSVGGDYQSLSQLWDSLVIGNLTQPIIIVFSSGNYGRPGAYTVTGYQSQRSSNVGKNVIVVGSTGSDTDDLSAFSSKGPTNDSRLKPDVVAPGCENNTYYEAVRSAGNRSAALEKPNNSIFSTYPNNTVEYPYYGDCGTSMSAPAVAGSLALMLEVFGQNHEDGPLPSTMKAVLIQTAIDLDRSGNGSVTNDGPDFMNGWGLINVTRAVNLIMNDTELTPRIIEDTITGQGETDYYNITVPLDTTEITVTLAWDDVPGVPNDGLKELQNDLDIFLIDPDGLIHYPWVLNASNFTQAAFKGVDDLNNVEKVQVFNASGLQAGTWGVVVNGSVIPQPNQSYSLVATPNFKAPVHAIVLLLDTSGSMGWDPYGATGVPENETRLYTAKQAARYFLDLLNFYKEDNTTFGVATFPAHPYVCPSSETVYEMATLDNSTKDVAKSAIDNMTAGGGTPMAQGIETAQGMMQGPAADKTIILFSDGYHNCPSLVFPMDVVNTSSITTYTIGYGNTTQVNHALLEEISNATGAGGEGEGFYVADNTTLLDLAPVFKSVIADLMDLYSPLDPAVTIQQGAINTHPISITEYDDKIAFSLSWGLADAASPSSPPLQLKLIAPDGTTIDPSIASGNTDVEYLTGDTYQVYFVGGSYLDDPAKIGKWQMQVDASNLPQSGQAIYHYSVLLQSDLRMDVSFDEPHYGTGDPVLVKVKLTEDGMPVALEKLAVKVRRPDEGPGNWYAKNKVTSDQLGKIPREMDGELLPGVYRKYLALTEVLGVAFPSSVKDAVLDLYDDGAHGDGDANDGVYANYFRDAKREGIYTFTIFAEGSTNNNNPYTRDRIIKKYVTVNVDPGSTDVTVELEKSLGDGYAKYSVTAVPMDSLGNYLGPGYARLISFKPREGELIGGLVDNLDGSYTQSLKIDTAKTEAVTINIKGVEFKQEIKPNIQTPIETPPGIEPTPSRLKWLGLLIIILILIVLLWWRFKT